MSSYFLQSTFWTYLPPKSLRPMEHASLDPHFRKELAKNTPQCLFKINRYLPDIRLNRKQCSVAKSTTKLFTTGHVVSIEQVSHKK